MPSPSYRHRAVTFPDHLDALQAKVTLHARIAAEDWSGIIPLVGRREACFEVQATIVSFGLVAPSVRPRRPARP